MVLLADDASCASLVSKLDAARMLTAISRCLVAGGDGQVGRLFTTLLADSGVKVTSVDTLSPRDGAETRVRYERGDITVPRGPVAEQVAQADLVLLAVPERVALAAVAPLTAMMRPGTLLADTLSVKGRIAELFRSEARHVEAVSLNPMFAPSLGMAGRPVAVITLADGPRARALRELLASWGARVVPIEAADHDRLTAAVQVATHGALLGFGFALQDLGVTTEELCGLAPPPHLTMLGMLARIASGVPEVYWDIQASNPEAPFARKALQRGIERLATVMENGCEADFAALLAKVKDFLSPYDADLADVCTKVFNTLPPAPGPGNVQVNRT